jgi:hypothetical protein
MPDAALVLTALVCLGAVVLACRARLSGAAAATAAQALLYARAVAEIVELKDERERAEQAWRHERMALLNRIQAPMVAVGEAYGELDQERRSQERGQPREVREQNWDSEDVEARQAHAEQARAMLEARGISQDELARAAAAHRGDHAAT